MLDTSPFEPYGLTVFLVEGALYLAMNQARSFDTFVSFVQIQIPGDNEGCLGPTSGK